MWTRRLGRSTLPVSALGLGCWAIGGPFWRGERPIGWGAVDDDASVQAIEQALDVGITLFDTADVYGCGHSEEVLGRALGGRRAEVVIATKFGLTFDEHRRQMMGTDTSPAYIRRACDASLRRLGTGYIDLYTMHPSGEFTGPVEDVLEVLEELVAAGKIRWYGWSHEGTPGIRSFAAGPHCTTAQNTLHVLDDNPAYAATCEELDLAWVCNCPLAQGILTGKFRAESRLPADDVRRTWNLQEGKQAEQLRQFEAIREVLTSEGRTPAQGALAWIWARSTQTIPIPGFKTVEQVDELAGAARSGPLSVRSMQQIAELLGRVG
jgi:aryl-alcohol dehydrogenase-like predicted oxidoreductase